MILFKILYSYGVIVLTEIWTCTTLFVLLLELGDVQFLPAEIGHRKHDQIYRSFYVYISVCAHSCVETETVFKVKVSPWSMSSLTGQMAWSVWSCEPLSHLTSSISSFNSNQLTGKKVSKTNSSIYTIFKWSRHLLCIKQKISVEETYIRMCVHPWLKASDDTLGLLVI